MSTALKIGPTDHGRELSYQAFMAGDYEEGYHYELIDGRLYVSPMPGLPHDQVLQHINEQVVVYKLQRPDFVKRLSHGARVFIPARRRVTCPEPDFAIYRDCPLGRRVDWRDISPIIVVEVVSPSEPEKDYERNVALYREVPSILEYWVFDRCDDDDGPVLRVYSRAAGDADWTIADFSRDATNTTPLLPGLSLPIAPSDV